MGKIDKSLIVMLARFSPCTHKLEMQNTNYQLTKWVIKIYNAFCLLNCTQSQSYNNRTYEATIKAVLEIMLH